MAKYLEIAELLQRRIRNGEYPDGKLPSLRKLAADMGVSYLTARQAMKHIEENGGLQEEPPHPLVAMITPLWNFSDWHHAIRSKTIEAGGCLRFITFSNENDPVISESINGNFDLIFLNCTLQEGTRLFELVRKERDRVVVMAQNMSQYGIRSLEGAPVDSINLIVSDLAANGITRIDAIGRNPKYDPRNGRLEAWKRSLKKFNCDGKFHALEHRDYEHEDFEAYTYLKKNLQKDQLPEAFFCLSPAHAAGLYRYCYENGIQIGRDLSVFAFGGMEYATMMTPPLATIQDVGIPELIASVLAEYRPDSKRSSKLYFQLTAKEYFKGNSLVPFHKSIN